jgi:hypothetical protein
MSLPILILLSACSGGSVTEFCAVARPILPGREDRLTAETARQIVAHNETGESRCRWGAPR